jgi:uncharacterized membrane-anchored protein YitT (DUF2179 family)
MSRGGTLLNGKGMYSEENKQIIFTIVNRREVEILKEFVYEADPDAFISVMNTQEILGHGFKPLKESVAKD